MADAVTNRTLLNSKQLMCIHLTNLSDNTGESNVVKIDKSALTDEDGVEPASLDIVKARWNIQGMTYVKLSWDHTTDDTAMLLSGNGVEEFKGPGSSHLLDGQVSLTDPRSSGATGDLLLSTPATPGAGSTYDITLWVRKNPS